MKNEIRYTAAKELRVQTAVDGSKTIQGYAIVWNAKSVDMGFTEVVAPGSLVYDDCLCLRDHKQELLMGRVKSGTLTLTEDSTGLFFVCKLPNTTQANDLAESISRGDLDGVSFGFSVPDGGDSWTSDGKGNLLRTLHKINLAEISPCSFAAYPASSVSVRSCPPELRSLLKTAKRNSVGCDCDCPACLLDDCEGCSETGCDDPECRSHGCPMQDEERSAHFNPEPEDLGRYQRLVLALKK